MSKENKEPDPEKIFYMKPYIKSEGSEAIEIIGKGVVDFLTTSNNFRKKMKEIGDDGFETYKKHLQNELNKKNLTEGLRFLIAEKHKMVVGMNNAKHELNGFNRDHCKKCLELLILPKISEYEELIAFNEKFPLLEKNTETTKTEEPLKPGNSWEIKKIENKEIIHSVSPIEKAILIAPPFIPFDQISCNATKEQILDFFMVLTKAVNLVYEKPFMQETEVSRMLNKCFTVFGSPPTDEYFAINLTKVQKGIIRYFLYQFYDYYDNKKSSKTKYAYFLKCNFTLFKNDTLKFTTSVMGESKKGQNYIDIAKYGIKRPSLKSRN